MPVLKSTSCCGHCRESKFCHDCGRQLRGDHDLAGLLKHCIFHAMDQEERVRKARSGGLHWVPEKRQEKYLQRMERTAEKWRSWADQLADLIQEAADAN